MIYDITNSTFYTDTNKYFSCGAKYKSNYYGGGAFSGDVFHDYYGRNDLGVGITCTIVAEMIFKTLHRKKLVGEMQGGAINYPTLINHTIECDDDLVFSEQIL